MDEPTGIPVMLQIHNWRCLVVGGGKVAARRCKSLKDAGAVVTVIAPEIDPAIEAMGVETICEGFDSGRHDVENYALVVIATSNARVNDAVYEQCTMNPDSSILVNRADDSAATDFSFMTAHRDGPLTIAVHSGGASAGAAVRIRDLLVEHLDPHWAKLLELALPIRHEIQRRVDDPAKRTELLRRLTDDQAITTLKTGGESALQALYADMMKDLA